MSDSVVTLEMHDGIAVVTIDNPPVNAVSHAVRQGLSEAFDQCAVDASVTGIVIACAGRTFVAGADITEFGKPPKEPTLRQVIEQLESLDKPSVAAIHGTALGGGLELALACRFRVAQATAQVGLPEVKLGLLPGAGGTVRLPYLIGPVAALDMIASGDMASAELALETGLVDAVCSHEPVAFAESFLAAKIAARDLGTSIRTRREKLEAVDMAAFDEKVAAVAKKAKGLDAPVGCADAVRNVITLDFDAALAAERAIFDRLMAGTQSKAQRHLFFAERAAAKVDGMGKVAPRAVAHVGVIGAGTMGGGIAMAFANAGLSVTVVDVSAEALARGKATIEKNYAVSVKRGSLDESAMEERLAHLSFADTMDALAGCDLIIEAVFEDMSVKKDIFGRLDAIAKSSAILATNTSYLDVNEIAQATSRPGNVVGMHFFSPANVMKLLEIVRGTQTAEDVLATVLNIAKRIGKVPVVVGVCRGFVGNRMLAARSTDLVDLLLEGATPAQVDRVFTEFGWPMGPFQMQDLAGLDIGWRNRKALGQTLAVADDLCEKGHFGQKTGQGYYRYESGARKPIEDQGVLDLIEQKAAEAGTERREVTREEIQERTLFPLVNEGARVLEENIAARSSDIDVVWVFGYGFPKGKGGPMFWAETYGLDKIVERLEYWHARTGKSVFAPADNLKAMAAEAAAG